MEPFSYTKATFENIPCAICGSVDFSTLATRSKNNLICRTVMCKNCGLIFISPRMTRESYDDYYKYFYRKDRDTIKGTTTEEDVAENFKHAKKFGVALAETQGQFLGDGLTIDVGSSTGGVLAGLKEKKPTIEMLGVEPSVPESEYAKKMGVPTITALFENFVQDHDYKGKAANIFCVQSLNHLLEPAQFIEWSHETLRDGGHLFLAVKNFKHQVRRAGSIEGGIQIDHVYMFTPQSLKLLVESRGFQVVSLDVDEGKSKEQIARQREMGLNKHHIRLVARKISRQPKQDLSLKVFASVSRFSWWKERLAFSKLGIKIVYILRYSRFSPLKMVTR